MANIGVISDIHSNFEALKTTLKILDQEEVSKILVCGDIVGYGRMPNQCCALLRSLGDRVVAVTGNHDWAAIGRLDYFRSFSPGAIQAMNLTIAEIDESHLEWLSKLPLYTQWSAIQISHTAFCHPERFPYLDMDPESAAVIKNFRKMKCKIGCVGHSHVPALFRKRYGKIVEVESPCGPYLFYDDKLLINVGSVGCPRTQSGLGSLVVLDLDEQSVCFHTFRI